MSTYRRRLWAALAALGGIVIVSLGAVAPAAATSGTMYVTTSTTLSEDHQGPVIISANNVTLDCAGHAVTSLPGQTGVGVGVAAFSLSGVTIRNCHVSGFAHGISLSGVTSFNVSDNVSLDNRLIGIVLMGTHGVAVANVASGNGTAGISVGGGGISSDIRVTANTMADNGGDGYVTFIPYPQGHYDSSITLTDNVSTGNADAGYELNGDADAQTLVDNRASGNAVGYMVSYSNGHVLDHNLAEGNTYSGFAINASSGDEVTYNVSRGNGTGFYADRLTTARLVGNLAEANSSGFWLSSSADDVLEANKADGNGGVGFFTYGVQRLSFEQNIAVRNESAAFVFNFATGTIAAHNVATENDTGFALYQATGGTFDHNVANGQAHEGFITIYSSDLTFTNNVANGNSSGFVVTYLASGNTFTRNVANTNETSGFWIQQQATGNVVSRCVAHANGFRDAVDDNPTSANTWTNNNFGTTSPAGLH